MSRSIIPIVTIGSSEIVALLHLEKLRLPTDRRHRVRDWDMVVSNAVVLTMIGGTPHHETGSGAVETGYGDSFVVDCARTGYDVAFDPAHLLVNLTIPHDVLQQVCFDWFGIMLDDRLWQFETGMGDRGSSWQALLEHLARAGVGFPAGGLSAQLPSQSVSTISQRSRPGPKPAGVIFRVKKPNLS